MRRAVAGEMERSQRNRIGRSMIGKLWRPLAEKRTVAVVAPVLELGAVSCTKEIKLLVNNYCLTKY